MVPAAKEAPTASTQSDTHLVAGSRTGPGNCASNAETRSTALLRAGEAGVADDLGPAQGLGFHEGVELVERALADRDKPDRNELPGDLLALNDGVHLGVELLPDRPRGISRRNQHLPGGGVEAGQADLGERRNLGRGLRPLRAGDPERA